MKKLMALIAAAITFTVLAAAPASASSQYMIGCVASDNGQGWAEDCFEAGDIGMVATSDDWLDVVVFDPADREACGQAYVMDGGDQQGRCGTGPLVFGQENRPLEALTISIPGWGKLCMRPYVEEHGWQDWQCGVGGNRVTVGTPNGGWGLGAIMFYYSFMP
jgi:hypothetical protein